MCFDFGGPELEHVELLVSFDGRTLKTIGGNTSSGPGGSQSNGGGVFNRDRNIADVGGFARPRWT